MFAAKQGFYYKVPLGPTQSPFWVAVFDNFLPSGIDVGNNANPGSNKDFSYIVGTDTSSGNRGSIYRLDRFGNIDFQKKLNGAINSLQAVITDGNQLAHVCGGSSENGTNRPYTGLIDASGNIIWEKYLSNAVSSNYNDIFYQDTVNFYNNICVGRINSTANGAYMAYGQNDGTLYSQTGYNQIASINCITKNIGTGSATIHHVGTTTASPRVNVYVTNVNNSYTPILTKTISDLTVSLGTPYVQYQSNRIMVSTRYAGGTNGNQPNILVLDANTLAVISQSKLGGQVTSAGLRLTSKQNNTFYGAATKTNNTAWYGFFDYDGTTIYAQNDFRFGTIGTHQTIITGIAGSNGVVNDGIYLIGTTNYYGATKGFVAKLPYGGSIPGTGVYGASNEIHLSTSTTMSITTSTLNVTTPSSATNTPTLTNTNSTLTLGTTTNAYTLNEAT